MSTIAPPPNSIKTTVEGGRADLATVLAKANEIYDKWIAENIDINDHEKVDAAYKRYRTEYHDFAVCYPLAFRYIIQLKTYNARAFHAYLVSIKNNQWKNHNDFLESQADYDLFLYKAINPRASSQDLKERRASVGKSLKDDWASVQKAYEEVKKEQEVKDQSIADRLRAELLKEAMIRTAQSSD